MITMILAVYTRLLEHYRKEWHDDKVDKKYEDWQKADDMRENLGFNETNFERIPKRKIRSRKPRSKHHH